MSARDTILQIVHEELAQPVPPEALAVADRLREIYGSAVRGILFYGSCLRTGDDQYSLLDFYVLVDSYWNLGTSRTYALLNALLPPNVYYLEVETAAGARRAKCTAISCADFTRGVHAWFHSYLWGRFCQPVSLAYARDADARRATLNALCEAVIKFAGEAICLLDADFDTRALWSEGLRTSYATELRSEGPDRADELFAASAGYYDAVTRAVANIVGLRAAEPGRWHSDMAPNERARNRRKWRVRAVTGKFQALARILKAWITFDGGFDYIIWKLERHSGRRIEVPERVRRRPAIHMWGFFWRLYRAGVFR
ncbi:MAG TPA: hypothetical protein VFG38_15160 [Pseudomonadales bacterium]|nr:hypothetical protein [Pseudomonadales bacterium]